MSQSGFTLIELLIVIAIVGILATFAALDARDGLRQREERSAVQSIQQSVWQGATAASARGRETRLVRDGQLLYVEVVSTGDRIRTEELADGVTTNLPTGTALTFSPPGRITNASLDALPETLTVQTSDKTYVLEVSVIGEVKVVRER